MSDTCPGCDTRNLEISRLKESLAEAKAAGGRVPPEAESRIRALEGQLTQAQKDAEAKVQAAESKVAVAQREAQEAANKPAPWPSVADFLGHCESGQCSQHKGEWDKVKSGIVNAAWDNIPTKMLEQRAEALGLIPKRIRISVPG